ncbi:MAG: hypothetical protein JSV03_07680, partial [Planctomycetota bacterium]
MCVCSRFAKTLFFGGLCFIPCFGDDRIQKTPGTILEVHNTKALKHESEDKKRGRYDWGPSVMYDGGLYRMWWVRLGGTNQKRFPYATTLPNGQRFEFTYPDWGDRIYYAESRDGHKWRISGKDYIGSNEEYGPDTEGPLMVLGPAETDQERNHIGCPSVIKVDGKYYLYYEAASEFVVTLKPDGQVTVGNEYHNQIFVAISEDGRNWKRYPNDDEPQPIVRAPIENKRRGRQRYGLGQPSVFYRSNSFVMHYVDSCTGPGDFIVRIEADNPFFANAKKFPRSLKSKSVAGRIPSGAVARFAQTDVKFLGNMLYLLRPAYQTGNLGILADRIGGFGADTNAVHPKDVFPQIRVTDSRGVRYLERLFPRFLTNPEGQILEQDGK